jgi:hypothetical protein
MSNLEVNSTPTVGVEIHDTLSTINSLPALSVGTAIYALSFVTSLCCFFMGFAAVMGPMFVIIPWLVFYGIKRKQSYFRYWSWLTLISVLIGSSIFGFIIFYCAIMLVLSVYMNPISIFFMSLFMVWNLSCSILQMKRSMSQKKRSKNNKSWKLALMITLLVGCGLVYTYIHDTCTLTSVARSGSMISTKILLAMNIDINGGDCYNTPLIAASNNPKMIDLLLNKGADVHLSNQWGLTALHKARGRQSVKVASLLIKAGAEINASTRYGKTPIFYAIQKQDQRLVQFFIQQGADLSYQDQQGNTPLHMAASKMNEELIQSLIKAGADSLIINQKGKNPLESMNID